MTSPGDVVKARVEAMLDRAVSQRIPLNGSIAMTHRCHLRCVHCYLGCERQALPAGGELDTAFWCSVVDQVADAGCLEPPDHRAGSRCCAPTSPTSTARARQRGILVTVFTNGTLIDGRIARLFEELPPQLVEVTLYGASEETYERVTGVRGSYRRCLDGVDALLGRGVAVGLKSVIMKENQDEMSALRRMASERGVRSGSTPRSSRVATGTRARSTTGSRRRTRWPSRWRTRTSSDRTADYFQRMQGLPPEEQLFSCLAGVTGFHVDPLGTLLPCLMVSTHGYDLRQGTFREGWETAIPRFREQGLRPGLRVPRVRDAVPLRDLPGPGRHGDREPPPQGRVPLPPRRGAARRRQGKLDK